MSLRYLPFTLMVAFSSITGKAADGQGVTAVITHTGEKANAAIQLSRAMQGEIVQAQKALIAKFNALPESDDIRIDMGKYFYGWSVSEKAMASNQERFDSSMAGYEKDFSGDALVDELRVFAKSIQRNARESIPAYEQQVQSQKQSLVDGKTIKDGKLVDMTPFQRKLGMDLLKILAMEIDFQAQIQRISTKYLDKISTLLH